MIEIQTPISEEVIKKLRIKDEILIKGVIYTGRDAVLPKLVGYYEKGNLSSLNVNLKGSVIFHTAVSRAGIGPTSSNKLDIESSIPILSKAGVKIHLGKGSLGEDTVEALKNNNSIFAITPPVTALMLARITSKRVAAFAEEGMEAMHELVVEGIPAIVAIAGGESIFHSSKKGRNL